MPTAYVVVDLGFGDAGKGSVVDFLCSQIAEQVTVVRYNGGPQAAHNVVAPDGRHHVFAQFGSGAFHHARTHLSRFMLINPLNMEQEAQHLETLGLPSWDHLTVAESATVITPIHVAANRVRETLRGDGRHGSCGQGIGETVEDSLEGVRITAGDLRSLGTLRRKFLEIQARKEPLARQTCEPPEILLSTSLALRAAEDYARVADRIQIVGDDYLSGLDDIVVFEGAQGVLLDEYRGFHPYTTWSRTTSHNALELAQEADLDTTVLGLLRAYATRHGPGPFPTEDPSLTIPTSEHNEFNRWQRSFRMGYFDLVLARYAISVCPVDSLGITCLDQWDHSQYAYAYEGLPTNLPVGPPGDLNFQSMLTDLLANAKPRYTQVTSSADSADFANGMAWVLNRPLALMSYGPTFHDKLTRQLIPGKGGHEYGSHRTYVN